MRLLSSWVLTLGLLAVTSAHQNESGCSQKICREAEDGRPVCGSDGVTYPNRCHLEKGQCQNKNLTLVHRGSCTEQRPCLQALAYATSQGENGFRPQCRPDGSYASAQCHPGTGYCWCVTPQGTPIPQTSIRWTANTKPRCRRKKKTTRRRSSSRSHKPRRACQRADRALFNNNLINLFHTEYIRDNVAVPSIPDIDRTILEWKFKILDRDHNSVLDKTEYRDLRKVVKKAVKPKRCAKSFAKACDMNRDQLISNQEWADCLSRDGMDDARGDSTANSDDNEYEEDGDDIFVSPRSPPHGVLVDGHPTSSGQNYEDDSMEKKDEDATDCISDRQTALNEQRADMYQLYVPECTPDGRYQKIQCYKSAGYCWCVNEDTGKNIPGTSVKNQTPKCDQIPAPSRPMKGCPDEKKFAFLKDLMEYLHQRMLKETNGTNIAGNGATWKASREEQVATWSFVVFDKNKNKVLDRIEWKSFKDLMAGIKNLKRCGKKLPRYCDINKDRQISMTEWLDCLNTQRHMSEHVATTVSPGSTRTGKNPLTMLIDD